MKLWEALDEAKGTIENMKEVIEGLRKQLNVANNWHKVDMKAVRDKNLILELARARRVTQIDTLTRRNEWQARRIEELETRTGPFVYDYKTKRVVEPRDDTLTITFSVS